MGNCFFLAAVSSGLFFLIAEDTTSIVTLSIFCFLCPIKTLIFYFQNNIESKVFSFHHNLNEVLNKEIYV